MKPNMSVTHLGVVLMLPLNALAQDASSRVETPQTASVTFVNTDGTATGTAKLTETRRSVD